MAKKPDGKPARPDRVSFTKDSAERISKVVRAVEAGSRDMMPFGVGPRMSGAGSKTFRVATFTGSWNKNTAKVVTFRNQTVTPNTVSATNLLYNVPPRTSASTQTVLINKEGTAWYFVNDAHLCDGKDANWLTENGYNNQSTAADISSGNGVQVLVNDSGCLKWVAVTKVRLVFGDNSTDPIRLTSGGLEFKHKEFFLFATPGDGSDGLIEVTSCSSTASA